MEPKKNVDLLRINKKSIAFNNRELSAIESYCKKYRINNRSKFMREAIITSILKKFDEDYPTLF
jgi:metal-responsive CopG/Arc/MetJ family transcriptional regulator